MSIEDSIKSEFLSAEEGRSHLILNQLKSQQEQDRFNINIMRQGTIKAPIGKLGVATTTQGAQIMVENFNKGESYSTQIKRQKTMFNAGRLLVRNGGGINSGVASGSNNESSDNRNDFIAQKIRRQSSFKRQFKVNVSHIKEVINEDDEKMYEDNTAKEHRIQSHLNGKSDNSVSYELREIASPTLKKHRKLKKQDGLRLHKMKGSKSKQNGDGSSMSISLSKDKKGVDGGDHMQIKIHLSKKQKIRRMLEHPAYLVFMGIITLFALYGDDIKYLEDQPQNDQVFNVITLVVMFCFSLEIVISSFIVEGYLNSFYFWLDIASTISLFLDLGWIWESIIGNTNINGTTSKNLSLISKTGRGARVGTRVGRIVRIVRLLRIIRVGKLYKTANQTYQAFEQFNEVKAEEPLKSHRGGSNNNNNNNNITINAPREESKEFVLQRKSFQRKVFKNTSNMSNGGIKAFEYTQGEGSHSDDKSGNENVSRMNVTQNRDQSHINLIGMIGERSNAEGDINQNGRIIETQNGEKLLKPSSANSLQQQQQTQHSQPNLIASQESKLGKKLSELTTRKLMTLVILIMFTVPIFTNSTYRDEDVNYELSLSIMAQYDDEPYSQAFNDTFQSYIDVHIALRTPLIYLSALNLTWQTTEFNPDDLRILEKEQVFQNDGDYYAIFDFRQNTRLASVLSICRTTFVCFVLTIGAFLFSKDANERVIEPISSMIDKINRNAQNPLEAAQQEEREAIAKEQAGLLYTTKVNNNTRKCTALAICNSKPKGPQETEIVEQTIVKYGALLALGFGEAGMKIIADNMIQKGDVDPMIQGNKVVGIFGFCDIRNFTDTTEVLQETVMLFVNEIADIVHGIVDRFSGAPNKNIGDAFLLVWKYADQDVENDDMLGIMIPKKSKRVSQIADMTVISFLKVIAQIRKSYNLDKYRRRHDLQVKMPNYQVKMGFGLHVGWAIEGAIGSEFKIDASYLSPNVNMASRLEAATKQFGVPILISGALYDILTPRCQSYMRHIDTVTVKGSSDPIELFTCDVETKELKVEKVEKKQMTKQEKKMARIRHRLERNRFRDQALNNQIQVSALFETDEDLKNMRNPFKRDFYEAFNSGLFYYLKGSWIKSREELKRAEQLKGTADYPSRTLLEYMKEFNYKCPPDWEGYRALTEK